MALIVIDMLNDFVTGSLKCIRAKKIIPNIKSLIEIARKNNIPVIYVNDAHFPKIDAEFEVWGSHAVKGTRGGKVIDELKPAEGSYVINKRRYSGFYDSGLDTLLRELSIDTVILTGLHTNCCVKHTAADAFFRKLKIIVPKDCVEALTNSEHAFGLDYMRKFYKAEITTHKRMTNRLKK